MKNAFQLIAGTICLLIAASTVIAQDKEYVHSLVYFNADGSKKLSSGTNHSIKFNTLKDSCVMVGYSKKRNNNNKIVYQYRMQNMAEGKYIGEKISEYNVDINNPFLGDGLIVNNSNPSIFNADGSVWLSFSDLKQKVFWGDAMKGHKIWKKVDGKNINNYWVSNFHDGVAAVGLKIEDPKYGDIIIHLIGRLHKKDKSFEALKKPINTERTSTFISGFTEEGYLVCGKKVDSRKVYNTNLESVSSKVFVKSLDEYPNLKFNKKYFVSGVSHRLKVQGQMYAYNEFVEQEKWMQVSFPSTKKEDKAGLSKHNFINKEGEFLLAESYLASNKTSYSRQFLNGKVTVNLNGKFVELNTKGEVTFTFPEGTIDATSFREGVALIETDKGVSMINEKSEIIRPWVADWTLSPTFVFPVPSFHAINDEGLAIVGVKSERKTIVIDTDFKIIENNTYGNSDYWLYDSKWIKVSTSRKSSTPEKDYTKSYPPNFVGRGTLKNDEVKISTGFIPNGSGIVDDNQTEKWYIHNMSSEKVKVKIKFDYSDRNTGYSDGALIFMKELEPGELGYIDPGPIPGVLKASQSTHAERSAKVTWWIVE